MSPPNDEALHAVAAVQGSGDVAREVNLDCVSELPAWKARASYTAELARRGYCLSELTDGSFLVHKWNYSRPLVDLRACAAFLRQVGG